MPAGGMTFQELGLEGKAKSQYIYFLIFVGEWREEGRVGGWKAGCKAGRG
jgi:hypothetical protein